MSKYLIIDFIYYFLVLFDSAFEDGTRLEPILESQEPAGPEQRGQEQP